MATFKMPNISKINSQMRKVKAASSQLERERIYNSKDK